MSGSLSVEEKAALFDFIGLNCDCIKFVLPDGDCPWVYNDHRDPERLAKSLSLYVNESEEETE